MYLVNVKYINKLSIYENNYSTYLCFQGQILELIRSHQF